jgi:hypothetical protein
VAAGTPRLFLQPAAAGSMTGGLYGAFQAVLTHASRQRVCSARCRRRWRDRRRRQATAALSRGLGRKPRRARRRRTWRPRTRNPHRHPRCPHCRQPVAIVAWLVPPAAASVATPPRHGITIRAAGSCQAGSARTLGAAVPAWWARAANSSRWLIGGLAGTWQARPHARESARSPTSEPSPALHYPPARACGCPARTARRGAVPAAGDRLHHRLLTLAPDTASTRPTPP